MAQRASRRQQVQLSRARQRTAAPARNKVSMRQRGTVITSSKLCVAVDVDEGATLKNVTRQRLRVSLAPEPGRGRSTHVG